MKVTCHQISLPESNYYDFHTTFTAAGMLDPPVLGKAKKPSVGRVKSKGRGKLRVKISSSHLFPLQF